MLEIFYPDHEVESAYEIDFERLYQKGYRGVIFDIDNTLVPHGAPADERATALFKRLHKMGLQTVLLSNNKEPRVKMFNDGVGSTYIFKAGKPGRRGYENAMKRMGTVPKNTVFVGDQLFTDIWGAKRSGIRNILVKPISKKEEIQIVIKRVFEKIILSEYRSKKKRKKAGIG